MAKKKVSSKKTAGRTATPKKGAGPKVSKPKAAPARASGNSVAKPTNRKVTAAPDKKGTPAKIQEARPARGKATVDGVMPAAKAAPAAKAPAPRKTRAAAAAAANPVNPDADGYVLINGRRVRMMSAVAAAAAAARRPASRSSNRVQQEERAVDARSIKSRLNAKQLAAFRELLMAKRSELAGDLSAMEKQALQSNANLSHMPIHMADIGTDTYDQDFMLGLAETERRGLREIDEALQRIQDGTYGICQLTGKPIPMARLNAKPWAKYTIEAARLIERGLGDT